MLELISDSRKNRMYRSLKGSKTVCLAELFLPRNSIEFDYSGSPKSLLLKLFTIVSTFLMIFSQMFIYLTSSTGLRNTSYAEDEILQCPDISHFSNSYNPYQIGLITILMLISILIFMSIFISSKLLKQWFRYYIYAYLFFLFNEVIQNEMQELKTASVSTISNYLSIIQFFYALDKICGAKQNVISICYTCYSNIRKELEKEIITMERFKVLPKRLQDSRVKHITKKVNISNSNLSKLLEKRFPNIDNENVAVILKNTMDSNYQSYFQLDIILFETQDASSNLQDLEKELKKAITDDEKIKSAIRSLVDKLQNDLFRDYENEILIHRSFFDQQMGNAWWTYLLIIFPTVQIIALISNASTDWMHIKEIEHLYHPAVAIFYVIGVTVIRTIWEKNISNDTEQEMRKKIVKAMFHFSRKDVVSLD